MISQIAEELPRSSTELSPAMVGPIVERPAQAITAAIAGRMSDSWTDGVALAASTAAVTIAARKGAIASQALLTPNAVSTVGSRVPCTSTPAQEPVPCVPRRGRVGGPGR